MNSFPVRNGPSLKQVRILFISRKFVVIALVLSKKTFKYGKCILTSFATTFISLWKWILPSIEQTKNPLHLRPSPTALADEKGIQKVKKKSFPPRRKTLRIRCVLIALCPSTIRTLWFHPRKKFRTAQNFLNGFMNFLQFMMSICNIYEQVYVHYHSLNVCGILSAFSWPPLNSHPLSLKTEGRKIRYMERPYIVSSTNIERCKCMHLVI